MAKKKSLSIRSQYAKLAQKIKVKSEKIKEFAETVPRKVAEEGLRVAQETLSVAISDPFFTQKHEYALVNEIGLKKSAPRKKQNIKQGNAYTLYAPVSGDREIAYEMYFAEYGAGIGAGEAKRKPTSFLKLKYYPTKVNSHGFWWYRLVNPIIKKDTLGRPRQKNYAYVNTSKAVNYMWAARRAMSGMLSKEKQKLVKELGVKVRTSIKRPKG